MKQLNQWVFALIFGALAAHSVNAQQQAIGDRWYFQTSLATHHWNPSPQHVKRNYLLNLERQSSTGFVLGGAHLKNSFGQPTQYLYAGKLWRPLDAYPGAYVKLTGGIAYGYKGEFRDKIPFNGSGVAPVVVPSIGISGKNVATELVIFGGAGVMWTVGVYWP